MCSFRTLSIALLVNKAIIFGFRKAGFGTFALYKQCAASTTTTNSLCTKKSSLESYAIVLENGVNLRRDFEDYLIHKLKKHLLREAIPSLLDFILAFLVLGLA
jgi:hypothetical protein